jgi:Mg2+/Co2+ transporter CorC
MARNTDLSGFEIKSMMRETRFVSESRKIDELFQEMRKERTFLVVVIDDRGGTMGIITMEDLIERIVGNIRDEYDDE